MPDQPPGLDNPALLAILWDALRKALRNLALEFVTREGILNILAVATLMHMYSRREALFVQQVQQALASGYRFQTTYVQQALESERTWTLILLVSIFLAIVASYYITSRAHPRQPTNP